MLKMTDVELKKIVDIDMYLFIEKGLRGGISYTTKRYSEANNKHMKYYDPTKQSKYISHLDMNNLYGWSMSSYLSYDGFKRLENVDSFDVISLNKKNLTGYFLKVDLEYPEKSHLLPSDYPLAPEKLTIPYDMLLDCCKKIADEYEIKVGDVKILIPNLGDKTNYVVHYSNL